MTAVVRPARSTDAGAVGAILSSFVDTTPWMPRVYTRAEDLHHAGNLIDRGWVTVSEAGGTVRAFAASDGGMIHALYVDVSVRRQGHGTALMAHLKQTSQSLTAWTFEANTGAQAFYAAHGFAEVARTDGTGNDEGLPDIELKWHRERS